MADTVLISTHHLEPAVRLRDAFRDDGWEVELLTPGEHVTDVRDPVLLILTGSLDDRASRRLAREAAEHGMLPVIAMLDEGELPTPDLKRRIGAHELVVKPVDPSDVLLVGRRLIERSRLRKVTGIVGETDEMIETLERVVQIAPVSSTVLITGESGTGKERVARGLHAISPRRHKPFIAANVAAMPETLLESELFGHEKGAFTGAVGQRKGFFELAHRGTLFLDEIGEMPLATQTKLLRVLEERRFRRLGGETEIEVDVRVVAATNQPLRQEVELGRFRRDLYFRLNVLHIALPPLRERRADIPLLVEAFIRATSAEHDRPRIVVSPDAMAVLVGYDWPGNVRELRNLVESMVVLSPGRIIRPDDIPPEIRNARGRSRLLPALIPRPPADGEQPAGQGTTPPELEFIFRTLMQMRMDVDQLRTQFDDFRRRDDVQQFPSAAPGAPLAISAAAGYTPAAPLAPQQGYGAVHIEDIEPLQSEEDLAAEHEVVVYRPGMTLADLERNAITAALREVAGNRRRAADMLGMGERTLYRKLKEYDIPL